MSKFSTDYSHEIENTGYTLFYKLKPSSQYNPEPLVSITGLTFISSKSSNDKKLIIPEKINGHNVERIACFAFCKNEYIEKVVLPDTIKYIERNAFQESSVKSVHLGKNIEQIGPSAFEKCHSLIDINLPEGLKTISGGAFMDCDSLTDIVFPDSLVSLGGSVFDCCSSLRSIHIGANLINIGYSKDTDFAFGAYNLEKITVSPLNKCYRVEKDILYNTYENFLMKVFNNSAQKDVVVPKWVAGVSLYSFDSARIRNLIINQKDLPGIRAAQIENPIKVFCVPGSNVDEYFKSRNVKTAPVSENKLNQFINELSCENTVFNK